MICEDETAVLVAIIGWGVLIIINVIGWFIISWQNRKLQKKQYKIELGAKTVDNGLEHIHDAIKKLNELSVIIQKVMFLEPRFMMKRRTFDSKYDYWQNTKIEIMDSWSKASEAFINVIMYLESREVILNKFVKIRYELLDKYREMEVYKPYKVLHDNYFDHFNKAEKVDFREVEKEIEPIKEVLYDLVLFLKDLEIGLQNEFLSEIFDNYKVPERKPEDPKYKVLRPSL